MKLMPVKIFVKSFEFFFRNGNPIPVSNHLYGLIKEVEKDLNLNFIDQKCLSYFICNKLDFYKNGALILNRDSLIAIPPNFNCTSVSNFVENRITVSFM